MKKILTIILSLLMIFAMMPLSFAVDSSGNNATITMTTDDAYELYVNGTMVGSGNSWALVKSHRVYLAGDYTIAVKGMDKELVIAGLTAKITFDDNATVINTTAGSGWVYSLDGSGNWTSPTFDDSTWSDVTNIKAADIPASWPTGHSWVWSPNYLATVVPFDKIVYFRYEGFNDLPDVTVLSPIFEGYVNNGNGNYTAFFGYETKSHDGLNNPISVNIPFGTDNNKITGDAGSTVFPSDFVYQNSVPNRPGRTPFFPNAAIRIDNWNGDQIVWTLNGKTATAGLSGTEHKGITKVRPIFEGWVDNGDDTYKAYFGYLNESTDAYGNPVAVTIPFGTDANKINGFMGDATFPSDFSVGRTPYFPNAHVMIDGWNGRNIVWTLDGRTATASLNADLEKELPVNPVYHTVTTAVVGDGTITVDPASGPYLAGSEVSLVATAATGWTFAGWSVDLTGTASPATLIMNGNKSVTATFTENAIQPTEPPVQTTTEPPAVLPTEVPTEPATEELTVEVEDEEVALGDFEMTDIDQFLTDLPAVQVTTEADGEVIDVDDEETPLADGLPETGQLPTEAFFGLGGLITAAGAFLKRKGK